MISMELKLAHTIWLLDWINSGLLEYQQAVQEDILLQCSAVINEISQYSNYNSESFQRIFNLLQSRVDDIEPEAEFKDFIEQHKSAPTSAQPPIFDAKLSSIQDNNHSTNPLRPDRVTVDDLTLEALKQKLRLLEQRLGAVQNELALKQTSFAKIETELSNVKKDKASEIEWVFLITSIISRWQLLNELIKCY